MSRPVKLMVPAEVLDQFWSACHRRGLTPSAAIIRILDRVVDGEAELESPNWAYRQGAKDVLAVTWSDDDAQYFVAESERRGMRKSVLATALARTWIADDSII